MTVVQHTDAVSKSCCIDACTAQSAEPSPGEPNVYETHAIVSETATFSTCRGGGDAERRA